MTDRREQNPPAGVADEVRTSDRIVEVVDETSTLAGEALQLIGETFPAYDRHSLADMRGEIAEKRLNLLDPFDYHMLALTNENGHAVGTIAGVYLAGVNAGFVMYLAVHPESRRMQLGRALRSRLVEEFRINARSAGYDDLAWVLGEIRVDNPWLHRLVRQGGAIPFDFTYYHPGMAPGASKARYVLYRQPVGDHRKELPLELVRRILFAIYRRAYRVRYPVERENFRMMLEEMGDRETIGADRQVMELAAANPK